MLRLTLLLPLLLCSCATSYTQLRSNPLAYPVVSHWELDVSAGNTETAEAASLGEAWPGDPMLVAHRFLGKLWDRSAAVSVETLAGETPTEIRITVFRDGFLDDAVAGDWHELTLELQSGGYWRITKAKQALRCRRGPGSEIYAAETCP